MDSGLLEVGLFRKIGGVFRIFIGEYFPDGRSYNGQLHGGFQVWLVEAWKDHVGAIGLELSIKELAFLPIFPCLGICHTSLPTCVIVSRIQNSHSILSPMQQVLPIVFLVLYQEQSFF